MEHNSVSCTINRWSPGMPSLNKGRYRAVPWNCNCLYCCVFTFIYKTIS